MDDASGQLGNNGTEIGYLVSGKNGVRFAISKVAELPPRGAVIQPVTQFVLHSHWLAFSELNYRTMSIHSHHSKLFSQLSTSSRVFPVFFCNLPSNSSSFPSAYSRSSSVRSAYSCFTFPFSSFQRPFQVNSLIFPPYCVLC